MPAQSACDLISETPIHDCIDTLKNVQYGQGKRDYFFPDPQNGCAPIEPLFTDIFQPCSAGTAPRPLIIFVHGGAFAAGNKSDFWAQCHDFARRGYLTATIQYRLSINLLTLNRRDLIRAGFRAQQDAKAAVRFFKANADQYNVDTSNIFMVGYSAGAVTALNVVYAQDADERPDEANLDPSCGNWFGCPFCPDIGTLEGEGGNPGFSSKVKAIYSMAGAVMDLSLMDEHDDAPVAMIHGTADETVAYDSSCFLNLTPCPKLYGSNSIQQRAEEIGLCTQLHTLQGAGHDMSPFLQTIVTEASAYFLQLVCEGSPCAISAAQEVAAVPALQVFPNPATDWVEAVLPPGSEGRVFLVNATGHVLASHLLDGTARSLRISLGGYPAGMYFLQWKDARSGRMSVEKLVVRG